MFLSTLKNQSYDVGFLAINHETPPGNESRWLKEDGVGEGRGGKAEEEEEGKVKEEEEQ